MRRTRAILAMLLAAGMATHALITRPVDLDEAPMRAHAALIAPEMHQLARQDSVERHDEEDEVMAVDANLERIDVGTHLSK